jgi:signal transduction histidine kinase
LRNLPYHWDVTKWPILQPALRSVVLLAVAALLPVIGFAAFNVVAALQQERRALERDALERTHELSEAIDRELTAQLDLVRSLAALPLFDSPLDPAAFESTTQRLQQAQPLWLVLLLADRDGNRIAASDGRLGRVVDEEGHRRVVAEKSAAIGNVAIGPRGVAAFAVRAPVLRDGEVVAMLSAVIRPDGLRERLLRSGVPAGWIGTVVDAAGNVATRTTAEAELAGHPASRQALAARSRGGEGLYDGRTLEGIETLSAYRMSPATGWSIHIGVPRSLFNAPLLRSSLLVAAGAAMCLALASLFILLLLREMRLRRDEAAALESARRMEALGRLTGGVAHDFNNLLTVILGNVEILEHRFRDAGMERSLHALRRAAERGTQLTRELLSFGRGGTAPATTIDLNARIRGCLGMLRHSLRPGIALELDLADDLPPVTVDPVQLDLALLNLAVNARDAMPESGTLRVCTRRAPLPDGRAGAALQVTDTGMGIAAEDLPRVFEPFFTTKDHGKGTGLGLTQVYGFARQAGGTATIESRVGHGTTVTIRIPAGAAQAAATERPTGTDAPSAAPPKHKRLLLVDDNAEVRTVTAEYLREHGYHVVEAADGASGLSLAERGGIDLVVSDIVMPGRLDGIALAREIRRRWPDLPIVLVSGYSTSANEARNDGLLVLAKPFRLAELDETVRQRLDLPPARATPAVAGE